ncbi:glycoside hydrolase family 35 protein [Kineococcus rhizosphaerae]|uniref:glycoside hydrolase family 35 protein n=1 Tax=Kineococcus rhizosphaerae TaxID=559628 RepID=UPI000D04F55F|nr:beta-galactosidase [Kineococcus rhizosphaerae]
MTPAPSTRQLTVGPEGFVRDGRPHLLLSGALHYFRVHPQQWGDRLRAARLLGLNTVETYVPWNLHAPRRGEFRTDGFCDLAGFLDAADREGLDVVVRPGPYICAEWDNGGLPVWLTRSGVRLRTDDADYLAAVDEFLTAVYDVVVPRQADRGGPVVLVQVENEYGAYDTGDDGAARVRYLEHLVATTRGAGITVPLTTVDQPTDEMLAAGTLPGLLTTGSFGGRAAQRLATLREHQPEGPLVCSEFWIGWFDHWGSHHGTTSVAEATAELDAMLSRGAGVNVYVLHGGTNFGFTNGANDKGTYQPTVTSYDYDALLDEAGRPTAKFHAFREVIARYAPVPAEVLTGSAQDHPPAPVLEAAFTASRPLAEFAGPDLPWEGSAPPVLDDLEVPSGEPVRFAWISGTSGGAAGPTLLSVGEVRDRVTVLLDGVRVGTMFREHHDVALALPPHAPGTRVDLLVEDAGRVNYGPRLGEPKGIVGPLLVGGRRLEGAVVRPVDHDALRLDPGAGSGAGPVDALVGPVLASAALDVPAVADLFLDTGGWGRGVAWVNGFCLGRYWRHGPQRSLYVPAPVVRAGRNVVTVLELDGTADPVVRTLPDLALGHTEA